MKTDWRYKLKKFCIDIETGKRLIEEIQPFVTGLQLEYRQSIVEAIDKMIEEVKQKEAKNSGLLEYLQMCHQGMLESLTELKDKLSTE